MRKIIYVLLFILCLGLGRWGEAAVLEGPWRYCETNETEAGGVNVPALVRENSADWALFDMENRPPLSGKYQHILLTVKVSNQDPQKNVLLFMTTKQAVRMWLDDEMFFSRGHFYPQRYDEGSQPYMVALPKFEGEAQLAIELYSDSPTHLGWFSLFSLDTEQMQMARFFYSDIPLVLAIPVGLAIIFIMFLYYRFNPQGWRRLYAYIILFMVVFCLWLFSVSNVKTLFWDYPRVWWYSLSILAYILPLAANLIPRELLKGKKYARMDIVIWANALLFVTAMVGEIMGMHTMNGLMSLYYPVLAIGEGAAVYWCVRAAREGDLLCRSVLLPIIVFTSLGVFDGVSGHFYLLPWHVYLTPLGIYAFLYFVVGILREQVRHEEKLLRKTAGLEHKAALMQKKSETDALTGCWNRNKLKVLLADAIAGARKIGQPFGMLMLDIDFFKKINDTYGHDAGDAVLRAFATLVYKHLAKEHECIRWGGEEFLILTKITEQDELLALAEKIREQVAAVPLAGHKITCSIGATLWQIEQDSTDTLFRRVDEALYQAKRDGRNRVIFRT